MAAACDGQQDSIKGQAAGGISEQKAIEIAEKAIEADLGLLLCIFSYGAVRIKDPDWNIGGF